jgi:hypothetical protein
MRFSPLLVAAGLVGALSATAAEALEQPTVTTTLRIDRERGGACTDIHAGAPGAAPALVMTDVCHDWAMASCFDKLLVRGDGVIEDRAQVLFTEENRAIDLMPFVDRAVGERWPGHVHLHLRFGAATCDGDSLELPFSGSHLKANTSGSAAGLRGLVRIMAPKDIRVSVKSGG